MDKPRPKIKNLKSKIIFFSILFVLFFAYVFPFLGPNGTGKFTGVEKQAAEKAISAANITNGNNSPNPLTFTVEDVYPARNDQCNDRFYSPDPNSIRYYAVELNQIWFFGIKIGTINIAICRAGG